MPFASVRASTCWHLAYDDLIDVASRTGKVNNLLWLVRCAGGLPVKHKHTLRDGSFKQLPVCDRLFRPMPFLQLVC